MADPSYPSSPQHHPAPSAADTQPISVGPPPPPEGPPSGGTPSAGGHAAPAPPPRPTTSLSPGTTRTVLHVLATVLVVVGITVPMDGFDVLWASSSTWAAFATLAAVAQLAALGGVSTLGGRAWTVGAAGAGGLVLFWTLLMLPAISTNMAFLVTLGTAAAVTAVLMSPDRRI